MGNNYCWEDTLCHMMVPVGIVAGFSVIGCVCGFAFACFCPETDEYDDDDVCEKDEESLK